MGPQKFNAIAAMSSSLRLWPDNATTGWSSETEVNYIINERSERWKESADGESLCEGRPIAPLALSAQERAYLERQVRRQRVARSLSERCRVILRCADGLPSKSVAAELGLHEHTVGKWRRRFLKDRCDGLLDEARPGRPRTIDDDQVAAVIERTLRTTPADATHWSIRSMAAETGFSHCGWWKRDGLTVEPAFWQPGTENGGHTPIMRTRTRETPSLPGLRPQAGYVDADCQEPNR
jgi:transposase